jgi:hypothetical protein
VLLVGQLLGVAHLLAVRHVACADHQGELVELSAPNQHSLSFDNGASTLHGGDSASAHEHCHLAACRDDRARIDAPASSTAAPFVAPVTVERTPNAPPPLAIALLDFAPKSSPPRAG